MKKITLERIQKESLWVCKMNYGRHVGTYDELEHYMDDDEFRDLDLLAEQPEHLKPFFDALEKYTEDHGFITIPNFYKIWEADEVTEFCKVCANFDHCERNKYGLYDCDEFESSEDVPTIDVLVIEPSAMSLDPETRQGSVHIETIPNTLEAMQKIVGGLIEIVPLREDLVAVCNEEGRLRDLPENLFGLCGTIFLCKDGGEDLASIR